MPAPLHACREARNHLLSTTKDGGGGGGGGGLGYYRKAFYELPATMRDGRNKTSTAAQARFPARVGPGPIRTALGLYEFRGGYDLGRLY